MQQVYVASTGQCLSTKDMNLCPRLNQTGTLVPSRAVAPYTCGVYRIPG